MTNVLEGNEYKSYIMSILASAQFSEDTKVPVTLTDYIYDPTLGKFQNEINAEVSDPKTVTVFVFKSTANETDPNATPNSPIGGSWDMTTDILQLPEGWTTNDELDAPVWLSYGVFGVKNGESTLIQEWSTPVRISGIDGIDGKDGNGYTYIYSRTEDSDTAPTWIENWTIDQALAQGWTDSPKGITETLQAEWVAILPDTTEENPNPTWQGPVLWSKWGVNGKDGDGVEYIYCLSTGGTPSINHLAEDNQQKREYVPKGETGTGYSWTDSPSGVTEEIKYEWVSVRKFNHETQTWGTFSDAKIWAKYGEKGESGQSVWIAYNDSEEQPVGPNNTIDLGNGWYFAEEATENNKPVWWCQKISQTVEGGTWGPVLKLNGKDGTSVTIKSSLNSEDDLCSIKDSEIGDSYLIGENLYIRVESESEGVKTCGNGTYWKNAGVIKGPKGDSQYLHIRYADRIGCNESNVCEYIFTEPDGTQPGRYLGTYVSNYKSADEDENITLSTAYSWQDTKGEPGIAGAPSEFYTISTNTNVIIKKSTGEYDPVNIIPYLKHVKGNVTSLLTAIPQGYELFYWNEGAGEWVTYVDQGEGLGILVNSLNEKIKFKLLRDSDSDNNYELVDELEVPIVTDGSDAYTIVYSDQNVAIECDFAGTPIDSEPRNVTIQVMKGSQYVNIKSGDSNVESITVTIDPKELQSVTTVFSGILQLLDDTELNYSINAIKVQPGKPAQNPIYIQTSQTSVLYECGIEPESGDYYLKSPTRAVELTFTLYEGQTQQAFSSNLDVDIESLSSSKTPFDSIQEQYKLDNENKTLTVTIPNLSDDKNLETYGDFKIIVSDIYNGKDVSAEVYIDFYIQEGVITKPLVAFTKTNDDISKLTLTSQNDKENYILPTSEGYTWYSNTDIDGNGQLWKAEGLAEIRKTSIETTYNVTWYQPYMLQDNDSREIIYTDKKVKSEIPSFDTYGGPTDAWFTACNSVNWYDDTVDSNGDTFEAMWMATNDKKSNQDWDDSNWVFSQLYNDNITYKILTSLPSQPTPGMTSFTASAVKLVNGTEDKTFTPNDYQLKVKVGDEELTPISGYYTNDFILGEIITIELFVNDALVEIFTAKVSKGDKGDKGDDGDKGDNGENARYLYIDKPTITVVVDEYEQAVKTDTYTVVVTLYEGSSPLAITSDDYTYSIQPIGNLTNTSVSWGNVRSAIPTEGINANKLLIGISYEQDIAIIDALTTLNISITETATGIVTKGTINIVYIKQPSRGEVGPMGETGPLMYPAGEWIKNKGITYTVTNNTVPYVYYPNDSDSDYFVLKVNETTKTTGVKDSGNNPLEDTTNWQPITQYEAIWTKVLMANFANIASAVFWGNYMFSEQGVTKDGKQDTLQGNNYVYYAESMFDSNENLSGTFIPNLLIDFNKGYLRTNYLLDSYLTIPDMSHNGNYFHNNQVIDLNNYSIYNIKIQPRFSGEQYAEFIGMSENYLSNNQSSILASGYLNYSTALICMPTIVENYKNGLTSKIIYEIPIEPKEGEQLEAGPYYNPNWEGGGLVIVCADNFILNKDKNESDSWFIKNGEKFKFILLSNGTILSLKLMIVEKSKTEKLNYWYIENTEDFAPVTATIARWIQPDDADTNTFYDVNFVATSGVNEATFNIHDYSFLGSKQLSYLSIADLAYTTGSHWGPRQFEFDLMYHTTDINNGEFTEYGYTPGWYIHNRNRGDMIGIYSQDPIIKLNSNSLPTWESGGGITKICRPAFIGQFLILSDSVYIGTELYSHSYGAGNKAWTLISSTN